MTTTLTSGGPTRPGPQSERDLAALPAQVVTVAMEDAAFVPAETEVQRRALARLEFENSGALLHDLAIDDLPIEVTRVEGGRA